MLGDGHLFNEMGRHDETVVEAMRRYCEDAWYGRRPVLARFSFGLMTDLDMTDLEPVAT